MTIRVAIAGGGIAGLCLARGLLQYPQLDVQVYEQVLQHRDKGGALTLHANALGAMDLIDPAIKQAYFRRANSMLEDDQKEMVTQVIMAQGKHMGQTIAWLGRAKGRKTIARLDLIAGYQALVPKERVHMGKRLEKIERKRDGEIVLGFADGSTATADCLIGADGIHSVTRQYLLGKDHPAALPVNHDRWYRVGAKIPVEVIEKTLSPKFLGFVPILAGPKGTLVMTPIRYGKTVSIGVTRRAQTDEDMGKLPDPADFGDYHPDCAKMVKLVLEAYNPDDTFSLYDHDPAPFFNKDNVVTMGDSAHATMPWIGNGAAQAIEDIPAAFAAFNEVRRPRALQVVELSRKAGDLYSYRFDGFWDEAEGIEALREKMVKIASFTNDADVRAQSRQAVKVFWRTSVEGEEEGGLKRKDEDEDSWAGRSAVRL